MQIIGYFRICFMLLLAAAAGLLYLGMTRPVIVFERFWFFENEHSIISGAKQMYDQGQWAIAGLIVAFSIIFPLIKLLMMAWVCLADQTSRSGYRWVSVLGKWSMLDVFVVFGLIGCVRLGLLAEASVEQGIYYFSAGVLLSLFAASVMGLYRTEPQYETPVANLWDVIGAGLLIAGFCLPLMDLSKWKLWDHQFSLLSAMPVLSASGEWLLAILLLVFVIVTPALAYLLRLNPPWLSATRWIQKLARWQMLDVFVLSLGVILIKLSYDAEMTPKSGFWCLLLAMLVMHRSAFRTLFRLGPTTAHTTQ